MFSRMAGALTLLPLLAVSAMAGGADCLSPHVALSPGDIENSLPRFEPEATDFEHTSFRGLSLGQNRQEALDAVLKLKFPITSKGSGSGRDVEFCAGDSVVGTLRFDEHDELIKLELRPAFFGVNKVVLREFADGVFEHYQVRPLELGCHMFQRHYSQRREVLAPTNWFGCRASRQPIVRCGGGDDGLKIVVPVTVIGYVDNTHSPNREFANFHFIKFGLLYGQTANCKCSDCDCSYRHYTGSDRRDTRCKQGCPSVASGWRIGKLPAHARSSIHSSSTNAD
jgi:hypothetical protein